MWAWAPPWLQTQGKVHVHLGARARALVRVSVTHPLPSLAVSSFSLLSFFYKSAACFINPDKSVD